MSHVYVALNMTTLKYEVFSDLQQAMYSCKQWGGNEFRMTQAYTWTTTLSNDNEVVIEQRRVR